MKREQGATMIIVLVVLLLVAIAGTIALRSGIFGMRLSTNSQITKLLDNNNDTALVRFEDMDADQIMTNFLAGGIYNYLLDPATADDELVFCYDKSSSNIYDLDRAGVIKSLTSSSATARNTERDGQFCDSSKFTSGRDVVITQVHLRKNAVEEMYAEGYTVSTGVPTIENRINVSLAAISVMPSFSSITARANEIDDCFKKTAFQTVGVTADNTIARCFTDLGIPHSVHNVDFESGNFVKVGESW